MLNFKKLIFVVALALCGPVFAQTTYQHAIPAGSGVLTAPATTGATPGTNPIGGANGIAKFDSNGTASAFTATANGTTNSLATWLSPTQQAISTGSGTLPNSITGTSFVPISGGTGTYFNTTIPSSFWYVHNSTPQTTSQQQVLYVKKDCTGCTTSGITFDLHLNTIMGASETGNEWVQRNEADCYSTVGTSCVGLDSFGILEPGGTTHTWGAIFGGVDATDSNSSVSGYATPIEVDLAANKLDDASNSSTYGGVGTRWGVNMGMDRSVGTDTTPAQFTYGYLVSQGEKSQDGVSEFTCGNGTQNCDYMGSAYAVSTGFEGYNIFDARGASPYWNESPSRPVIALNMQAGMDVDFASDVTGSKSLTEPPQRYLSYSTTDNALEYTSAAHSAGPLAKIDDSGNETLAGGLTAASASLTTALPITSGGTGGNSASAARTSLGLGTMATQNANAVAITGGSVALTTPLAVTSGGTGSSTASGALTALGAAPLASPALTGTPTAPTAPALTNNTQISTTAYTDSAVAVETARAVAAEALKANLTGAAFTGAISSTGTVTGSSYVGRTSGSAPAGSVGEYLTSTVGCGAGVALTSGTITQITSIPLTPGEWMLSATAAYNPAGTTTTSEVSAALSSTPGSLTGLYTPGTFTFNGTLATGGKQGFSLSPWIVTPSSNATFYLNEQATFGISTALGCGTITALRVG